MPLPPPPTCVDCGCTSVVMLTQQGFALGKRFTWSICPGCWSRDQRRTAEDRA